jgi:aryl-alcohol dehydrogenase-like predicted oxidoreductase
MIHVPLGRTGLVVSRLALGCMSYGSSRWRPWVLDAAEAMPFYRRAFDLGINLLDTADMYSQGASEEVTGRAVREHGRREELVVATKVFFPMGGEGPNRGGLSRKHVIEGCEASLSRLGLDAIDLYQVHRFDPKTPIDETLAALDQLVRQGKVRYVGASSTSAWKLMRALGRSDRTGGARFVSMQNHYNLVYREEEREMIPLCLEEGLGILPWSPLARGLLAGGKRSGDPEGTARAKNDDYTPRLYDQPGDDDVIAATREVAEARGVSMAEVALAWLLSRPGVTAPIVGATRLEHLDTAVRALSLELSEEEKARLEAPYQPHAVRGFQ